MRRRLLPLLLLTLLALLPLLSLLLALSALARLLLALLSLVGGVRAAPQALDDAARKANARELTRVLDAEFAKRDLAEWREILDGVGVTFGIVGTVDEVQLHR